MDTGSLDYSSFYVRKPLWPSKQLLGRALPCRADPLTIWHQRFFFCIDHLVFQARSCGVQDARSPPLDINLFPQPLISNIYIYTHIYVYTHIYICRCMYVCIHGGCFRGRCAVAPQRTLLLRTLLLFSRS